MSKLTPGMHIHLTGIGGVGLSAIARVLVQRGFTVSGSDRATNALSDALARDGATIYSGHSADHVRDADAVIITSALPPDHIEIEAARAQNIPVYKRSDIIMDVIAAGLPKSPTLIAIAGTHGKTTTTGMVAHILITLGMKPGYIIGGILSTTGTNADAGAGELFVIEADEYDNMFHGLRPNIAVVTNIEWDHPDFFKTPAEMQRSFETFVRGIEKDDRGLATLIIGSDDHGAAALYTTAFHMPTEAMLISVGAKSDPELRVESIRYTETGSQFKLGVRGVFLKDWCFAIRLPLAGIHNVRNAAIAWMTVVNLKGMTEQLQQPAADALATFKGTARRFELLGEVDQIAVISDYAHHPTAINVTLDAAHQRYPNRTIWAVWQPHTYSRTQALWTDFVFAFSAVDHVLVTDIYAARESQVEGITSAALVAAMKHKDARHTPTLDDAAQLLIREVKSPAVIVIMSAGDAPKIGEMFLQAKRTGSA